VVFYGSLSSANIPDPRLLTQEQRHEIVKNGLGDREMPVRKAAAGMLGGWLESEGVKGDLAEVRRQVVITLLRQLSEPELFRYAVRQFLKRFDVVNGNVAEDALLSLFVSRPAVADQLNFDGESRFRRACWKASTGLKLP
jgi:condensin complex subunit 3